MCDIYKWPVPDGKDNVPNRSMLELPCVIYTSSQSLMISIGERS